MLKNLLTILLAGNALLATAQSDSAQINLKKGLEEKAKGRRQESLKYFEKAYNYKKTDKEIITELATAYTGLGRYELAKEKYQQLEKMGSADENTYRQLTNLSFSNIYKAADDAIKYANLLKKVAPGEKVAYIIGKSYYHKENLGEAIKYLQQAAQEEPAKADIPYTIALAYVDMSNYKLAIPYFQQAMALDTTNTRWMYEIALIYYAMNDDANSLKYMQLAAAKGHKQDSEFLENMAIAYLNAGKLNDGIGKLKEILQRKPSDINILNMIAEGYYDAKKYKDAIDYYDQLLTIDKSNFKALYMIGVCFQQKGEKEKGMALCDQAIALDPSLGRLRHKIELPGGRF